MRFSLVVPIAAWVVAAAPSNVLAQAFTGRIDVSIEGQAGQLGETTVDIAGPIEERSRANAEGHVVFAHLPVGKYVVTATHSGFKPHRTDNVDVVAGEAAVVRVRLVPADSQETGAGSAEPASVDRSHPTITTHVAQDELQNVSTARDPWAILETIPTVYLDRLAVGGAESRAQARVNGKGAQSTDNTWSIDGVPVTDMGDSIVPPESATGSSALYVDVDSFEEFAITTGGADPQNPAPGVQIGMVLKKGMNRARGSARGLAEDDPLQSTNVSSSLAEALGGTSGKGTRTDRYLEYGFEAGGPFLKDRVWMWGSMTKTRINVLALPGTSDITSFDNYAFKADGLAGRGVRGAFSYYKNNKAEVGRDAGIMRPAETTWNETASARYYKGEVSFTAANRFFASARGASVDAGFLLPPAGGVALDYYIDDRGVPHNTYFRYETARPERFMGGDASYFTGSHEIRTGAAWRKTSATDQQVWPGSHLVAIWDGYPNMLVQVTRDYASATEGRYLNGYVSDTVRANRITVTGGVRFDRQTSSLLPAKVPGVAGFENLLPAATAAAIADVYNWTNVTPRIGVTFGIDEARKNIVRASYAMFTSQLPGSSAAFASPIQHAVATYKAIDSNSDGVAQAGELLVSQGLQGFSGFDPRNPARQSSVNQVDPAAKAPMTHELIAGAESALMPDLTVGAALTFRRAEDLLWAPLVNATEADYTQTSTLTGTLPGGAAYSVPVYSLRAAAVPAGAGRVSTNRAGYHQRYVGFEVSATKRMAQRWMGRFAFSTNGWREYFDDPARAVLDPTKAPSPSAFFPFAGPQVNGGPVVQLSTIRGLDVFLVAPKYQLIANGLVEGPWKIFFGANLMARQGYAQPFFRSNVPTADPLGPKTVLVVKNVDDFRLPAVTSLDGRVEKRFRFGFSTLAIDFDVFNLFNRSTPLAKQYDVRLAGEAGVGQVLEIMNPRIARIGVRLTF